MSGRRQPLWAAKTALLVGSPITIKSGFGACFASAREPPPLISSSATNIMISVPRHEPRSDASRRPASTMATIGPLASQAPRPKSLPSRSMSRNGSLVQPAPTGTVSICELKANEGPAPLSIRPTTLARRSASGRISVAKPIASSSEASSAAASVSRPGGFCVSMATSFSSRPATRARSGADLGSARFTALSLSQRLRRRFRPAPAARRRSGRTGSSPRIRGWERW